MKYHILSCHISKKRMLQPSNHHIMAAPTVSPEGTQDRKRLPALVISLCSHPSMKPPEETLDEKHSILAPDS